jgi:hypothetical protein
VLTAAIVALAYTAVRMSRYSHPEVEQAFAATVSVWLSLRFMRRRHAGLLFAAATMAGVAAAMKYLGGAAMLVAVAAVVIDTTRSRVARLRLASLTVGVGGLTFLVLVPAVIFDTSDFWAGLKSQFEHQANGHLGYDSPHRAFGFYLTQAWPGSVGWPLAVALLVGFALVLARGSVAARLGALFVVVTVGVLGTSHVLFPHYILVTLPVLVSLGIVGLWQHLPASPLASPAAAGLLALGLVSTVIWDGRFVATARDPDTRIAAAPIVQALPGGDVIKEAYTDTSGRGRIVAAVGLYPAVLSCHCYVVISSYMEDRYRREAARYPDEVKIYDGIRSQGLLVATISPTVRLSYRWDLLPQWGAGHLSFGRKLVGPSITIFKLP